MNDQLAMMPTQLALRCISQGLRGGLPVVLGVAALTIGCTVFGAVKGVKACQKALEKPRAGENKGSKIMNAIREEKDGEVYAFEMKEDFYKLFAKEAKELGIPYAATNHDGVMHIITDKKNQQIIDMLKNVSDTLKAESAEASQEPKVEEQVANQDALDQQEEASNELESNSYREVPFVESLWHGIVKFAQEKIIAPLKDIAGVSVEETQNETIVSYDSKNEKQVAEISVQADKVLDSIKGNFDPEAVDALEKSIQNDESLPSAPTCITEVSLEALVEEFVSQNTPIEGDEIENNSTDVDTLGNDTLEESELVQGEEQDNTIFVRVGNYPEIREMIAGLISPFIKLDDQGKPDVAAVQAAFPDINKNLEKAGFKGTFVLTAEGNILMNFDQRNKNDVIAFAKGCAAAIKEGSFRQFVDRDSSNPTSSSRTDAESNDSPARRG